MSTNQNDDLGRTATGLMATGRTVESVERLRAAAAKLQPMLLEAMVEVSGFAEGSYSTGVDGVEGFDLGARPEQADAFRAMTALMLGEVKDPSDLLRVLIAAFAPLTAIAMLPATKSNAVDAIDEMIRLDEKVTREDAVAAIGAAGYSIDVAALDRRRTRRWRHPNLRHLRSTRTSRR